MIGINTAIYSRTGGNMGIGFAIPINKAVSAADALSKPRGYLGVKLLDVDPRWARLYGFTGGVGIGKVEEGTPAAKSGLQEGDVILTVDGTKMENSDDLRKPLAASPPGTRMKISFFRESHEQRGELILKLGERPNLFQRFSHGRGDGAKARRSRARCRRECDRRHDPPVSAEERPEIQVRGTAPFGHRQSSTQHPCRQLRARKGDIVLRINGAAPASHAEAVDAILNHSRDGMATVQVRKGNSTRIALMDLK